jgi:competence protein ComEA
MHRSSRPAREQLKDLLALHRGERRGVLVMMALLIALSVRVVYVQWFRPPVVHDLDRIRTEMEAWVAAREEAAKATDTPPELFPFDPNSIGREEWLALGLRDRQIDGIERYQAKGGRFRTKSDVAKLYGLRPGDYDRLSPYILLPDSLPRKERSNTRREYQADIGHGTQGQEQRTWSNERRVLRKVEVNTADSSALVALPGIGPSFARGILAYRDRLGGYHSLEQLAEVRVLQDKPEAIIRMHELLLVDPLMVRRIPINTCTVEELAAHPYARWKLAKPLIAYRAQHGPFKAVEDIKGCVLIDAEAFRKLAPYLNVE